MPERLIRELATLGFVETSTNLVFLGPPGVGKTHLASALAGAALDAGHSVLFTTLSGLAEALEGSPSPTAWRTRLRRYVAPRVLVIDEVGYTRLTAEQAHALFELVTARYEKGAISLTSNTSFTDWGALLGNDVLASALLDRLLHHAEVAGHLGRQLPHERAHRAAERDTGLKTTPLPPLLRSPPRGRQLLVGEPGKIYVGVDIPGTRSIRAKSPTPSSLQACSQPTAFTNADQPFARCVASRWSALSSKRQASSYSHHALESVTAGHEQRRLRPQSPRSAPAQRPYPVAMLSLCGLVPSRQYPRAHLVSHSLPRF